MRCPKCGYTSFDHNENCPKCKKDLTGTREMLNLLPVAAVESPFIESLFGPPAEPEEPDFVEDAEHLDQYEGPSDEDQEEEGITLGEEMEEIQLADGADEGGEPISLADDDAGEIVFSPEDYGLEGAGEEVAELTLEPEEDLGEVEMEFSMDDLDTEEETVADVDLDLDGEMELSMDDLDVDEETVADTALDMDGDSAPSTAADASLSVGETMILEPGARPEEPAAEAESPAAGPAFDDADDDLILDLESLEDDDALAAMVEDGPPTAKAEARESAPGEGFLGSEETVNLEADSGEETLDDDMDGLDLGDVDLAGLDSAIEAAPDESPGGGMDPNSTVIIEPGADPAPAVEDAGGLNLDGLDLSDDLAFGDAEESFDLDMEDLDLELGEDSDLELKLDDISLEESPPKK